MLSGHDLSRITGPNRHDCDNGSCFSHGKTNRQQKGIIWACMLPEIITSQIAVTWPRIWDLQLCYLTSLQQLIPTHMIAFRLQAVSLILHSTGLYIGIN